MGECSAGTGVVLEFEQDAMRGDALPDELAFYDQAAYTSLRNLYWLHRRNGITREAAAKEKLLIIREREQMCRKEESRKKQALHTAEMWKSIEAACIAYQKERTMEHADQLVRAVEGKL